METTTKNKILKLRKEFAKELKKQNKAFVKVGLIATKLFKLDPELRERLIKEKHISRATIANMGNIKGFLKKLRA